MIWLTATVFFCWISVEIGVEKYNELTKSVSFNLFLSKNITACHKPDKISDVLVENSEFLEYFNIFLAELKSKSDRIELNLNSGRSPYPLLPVYDVAKPFFSNWRKKTDKSQPAEGVWHKFKWNQTSAIY